MSRFVAGSSEVGAVGNVAPGGDVARTIHIVGLGGSLRKASTSRSALEAALDGAAAGGATTELIWLEWTG